MLQLSWRDIETLCDTLALALQSRLGDVAEDAVIVAVSRGGLIPGALIAHRMGIRRVVSLGLMSYGDGPQARQGALQPYGVRPIRADLVIDDIADSGRTAEAVRALYPDAPVGVLVDKTEGRADVIAAMARPAGQWVEFPWEP